MYHDWFPQMQATTINGCTLPLNGSVENNSVVWESAVTRDCRETSQVISQRFPGMSACTAIWAGEISGEV